ncbi:unnamed protein product, partial [Closterium sp. NIES-54]
MRRPSAVCVCPGALLFYNTPGGACEGAAGFNDAFATKLLGFAARQLFFLRHGPSAPSATAATATTAATPAPAYCATMASLRVLAFDHEGRPVQFDTWLNDLQLYLLSDSKDSVSLFDHVSGAATAPPTTADSATRSQWHSRDTAACLAICNHLPLAECAHFRQHRTAQALYDAVVARYSSLATAPLGRLLVPYLFPKLSTFTTVEDLVYHLRASDARYRTAVPAENHFLSLDPTSLTVDLLEQHLLTAETSAVAVGAARGTPRPPFFEGCSPSPLAPSYASTAAVDFSVAEDVGAASTSAKRRSSKGKGGKGGGGGSGGGGGGSGSSGGGSSGGGGGGGTGGGSGGSGGGGGGSGGSGGNGCSGTGGGGTGARRVGSRGGQRQQQQCRSETQSPQQLREWFLRGASGGSCPYVIRTGDRAGQTCGRLHTQHRCFSGLDDAWCADFGDDVELPRWADLLRSRIAIFDAILSAMYAFSVSAEGDCYQCVPPDPGIAAAALGASESGTLPAPLSLLSLHLSWSEWVTPLGARSLPIPPLSSRVRRIFCGTTTWVTPPCHAFLECTPILLSPPPLPPSPAPPCLPCIEGRQRAAPHSSSFPSMTAPLQTLKMDVWGPARVSGQSSERYFLLVVDDYTQYTTVYPLRNKGQVVDVLIRWIRTVRLQRLGQDFPVLRLHSNRGVMEVARTSMIHAVAPHFLWPFAVRYTAHQLNLWPRVSLPETSLILRWTGEVGVASVFRVWGSRAFVRDTSANKLSPRAIPCIFLGFVPDAPGWQFYHPTSRRVFPSQDVMLDESFPFYCFFPYRSAPPPPPPLFLAPGPPPVDPLPPQGPAPSGVSQVDPLSGTAAVQVAVDSGAARGAASRGASSRGAEPGGAESKGDKTGCAEPGGVETGGGEPWGAEPEGVEPGGAASEGAESGGAEPQGAASSGGSAGASSRLSPQQLREWCVQRARLRSRPTGAGRAGVAAGVGVNGGTATTGPGGARTRGTGAAGSSGVESAGAGDPAESGASAAGCTGTGDAGAGGAGVGGTGAGTQWRLRRPVYALRQVPHEWHDTLRTTLAALGFAPATTDTSLFLRTDTTLPQFYVLVYVDDLFFGTGDTEALALVNAELQERQTCTDLGELLSYLGLKITRDRARRTITLTQSHMVQQILQRFGFQFSSPQPTPLSTSHSLSAPPSDESVELSGPYPELVGCLMYLMTCTQPNLAYPLSLLARYVAPGRHQKGYTFSLGSGSVSWRSNRSSSVLSSSGEAEIYAEAMAAQELRWLTYLLTDLGEQPRSPPVLPCTPLRLTHELTTLTPLPAPVPVRLADPSGGPVLTRSSTVLPCLAVLSGSLSRLHLPSFSTNLVSTAALKDAMVTTTTPGGQRVSICTCTRTDRYLATFTRRPKSSLYTLNNEPPRVAASAQVSSSGPVAPPCSCRLLSHQTLLWHHRVGHPSLPRLRGMHSCLL